MDLVAAIHREGRRLARFGEAFGGNAEASEQNVRRYTMPGTTPGPTDCCFMSVVASGKIRLVRQKIAVTSSWASVCGRRDRAFREKVIGRGMSICPDRFSGRSVLLRMLRTFPLFHQPARQHGCGVFLHPKVEKRANLLAEIGGMAETREFVALQ
jgi:hypothetical protein